MSISRVLAYIFPLMLSVYGCADQIVSEADMQQKTPVQTTGRQASLSAIQKNVFTPTCALAGCHSGNFPQAGLNLSEGRAYSQLVNVKSILYPSFNRVTPGSSESSLLIKVLRGTVPTKMPPSGPINSAQIDSIAVWIDRGAPND